MFDKLIAEARELCHRYERQNYIPPSMLKKARELANALEAAEKQIPRWMSGLPEEDGKYLVWITFPHSGFMSIEYFSKDREKVNEYEMRGRGAGFYGYGEDGDYCVDDVEYWMPLPKGAEEET